MVSQNSSKHTGVYTIGNTSITAVPNQIRFRNPSVLMVQTSGHSTTRPIRVINRSEGEPKVYGTSA